VPPQVSSPPQQPPPPITPQPTDDRPERRLCPQNPPSPPIDPLTLALLHPWQAPGALGCPGPRKATTGMFPRLARLLLVLGHFISVGAFLPSLWRTNQIRWVSGAWN
jgi:hypothetical protein